MVYTRITVTKCWKNPFTYILTLMVAERIVRLQFPFPAACKASRLPVIALRVSLFKFTYCPQVLRNPMFFKYLLLWSVTKLHLWIFLTTQVHVRVLGCLRLLFRLLTRLIQHYNVPRLGHLSKTVRAVIHQVQCCIQSNGLFYLFKCTHSENYSKLRFLLLLIGSRLSTNFT